MSGLFVFLSKLKSSNIKDPFEAQRIFFENSAPLIIFDVGAYTGKITIEYKKIFPRSTIYCFEPFPDSFRELQQLSGDRSIKTYQIAISDRQDKTTLYLSADPTCNSFFPRPTAGVKYYSQKAGSAGETEVDTTTIDQFCNTENISQIDILKLDIEGAEIRALKGASDKLSKHAISIIYTEVMFVRHYEGGCLFHELTTLLEYYGYSLFDVYNLKRAKNGQLRWGNAIFLSPEVRIKFEKSTCV
jgi:FkbM family methyltransferase